ncbi:hypothetical protein GCM10025738_07740 [Microbacterium fluvii]
MRAARRSRRAIATAGTALGILAGSAAAALALMITVPAALGRDSVLPASMRLIWPVFVALLLVVVCAVGAWLISLRIAEARYTRRRDALTRSAYSMYDYWAAIPDLSPAELWALLDRYENEGPSAYADVPSPWGPSPQR